MVKYVFSLFPHLSPLMRLTTTIQMIATTFLTFTYFIFIPSSTLECLYTIPFKFPLQSIDSSFQLDLLHFLFSSTTPCCPNSIPTNPTSDPTAKFQQSARFSSLSDPTRFSKNSIDRLSIPTTTTTRILFSTPPSFIPIPFDRLWGKHFGSIEWDQYWWNQNSYDSYRTPLATTTTIAIATLDSLSIPITTAFFLFLFFETVNFRCSIIFENDERKRSIILWRRNGRGFEQSLQIIQSHIGRSLLQSVTCRTQEIQDQWRLAPLRLVYLLR